MRNVRWLALLAVLSLVLAACGQEGQSPEATEPPDGETAAPTSPDAEFEAMVYPEQPADCGTDDNPSLFSQISALDQFTVEFTLCQADVAFLSKIAFAAFAINDTAWLEEAVPGGRIVEEMNGTGPYQMDSWNRGSELTYTRFDGYWGDPAVTQTLIFRWGAESAQRLVELQAGTIDGMDNVGADDFDAVADDSNLALIEREGLNVFYVGMNNTHAPFDDERVRQAIAMGIDRQRIVDTFYPPGSEVASHFTPCAIPFGCEGDEWYEFDPDAARALLADAGLEDGFETQIHLRDVVRGYLPSPTVVAQEIQTQLQSNLGIEAQIDVQESGTFLDNSDAGQLPGLHLLGWGADYPDTTNFLDFHFGAGASQQFGEGWPDVHEPLNRGASSTEDADRAAAYEEANNALREHVPMVPIAHAGSATAYLADVDGGQASPLGNEYFAVMDPGGRDQFVWMQNAEPIGLYCADETDGESLRACEQTMEPLYGYEIGGTEPVPLLATECTPNDTLDVWTCSLREGVTFHDGATFDANDVVLSYAVLWDAEHELHAGRDGAFTYWGGLWGGHLNPPPDEE